MKSTSHLRKLLIDVFVLRQGKIVKAKECLKDCVICEGSDEQSG